MSRIAAVTASPVQASERLAGLDALRGFALYGVLLVNAMVSSRPLAEALRPPASVLHGSKLTAEWFAWVFFDGFLITKFVALFSLLFGMGLVLQTQRAAARGAQISPLYRRRLAILALIGFVHGCLLFEGDILLVYAVIGAVLLRFRDRTAGELARVAVVLFSTGLALSLGWAALQSFATVSESAEASSMLESHLHESTFLESLLVRPVDFLGWLVISSLTSFNWRVAAFFFVGAAIMKLGWVRPNHVELQRRVGLTGFAIGLTFETVDLLASSRGDTQSLILQALHVFCDEIGSLLLSLGYMGIVLWVVHSGRLRTLSLGLEAVGRTALTNYLMQSVVMNLVFMSYALDLFDEMSRASVLGWFSLIFVIQIVGSLLWLKRFPMGPVEHLWRKWTYHGLSAS